VSDLELLVVPDGDAVAQQGADLLAQLIRAAVAEHGSCSMAVSGGKTPRAAFARLAKEDLPWDRLTFFQVDERLAPDGDADRNLTHLREALAGAPARIDAMPVTDPDPDVAAAAYAGRLPERFDVVHLGIGEDGHTASLVPRDPVLDVDDRLVAVTAVYLGRRRMTLTYPALARADRIVWLVAGAEKRDALHRLLAHDPSIPAGRVSSARAVVLCDVASA
jgi:6-phosphogluconolactonase